MAEQSHLGPGALRLRIAECGLKDGETKPIWSTGLARERQPIWGPPSGSPGHGVRNKPNSGRGCSQRSLNGLRGTPYGATTHRARSAKQSQSGGSAGGSLRHMMRNRPNSASGWRAKQSQSGACRAEVLGYMMRNRPNSASGWRAKQSQSPRWARSEPTLVGSGGRLAACCAKQSQSWLVRLLGTRCRRGTAPALRYAKTAFWWAQTRFLDAPGGTRTPNPQLRRLMLYPIKLQARDSRECTWRHCCCQLYPGIRT